MRTRARARLLRLSKLALSSSASVLISSVASAGGRRWRRWGRGVAEAEVEAVIALKMLRRLDDACNWCVRRAACVEAAPTQRFDSHLELHAATKSLIRLHCKKPANDCAACTFWPRRLLHVVLIMAALWNRAGHYIFALWFLSFFFFFPRLHVVWPYCEFRMQVWTVLHVTRWKYRTQKIAICAPLHNFVGLYLCN